MNESCEGSFEWNGRREEAAWLVAEGRLTRVEISRRVGVKPQSIDRWKAQPEFAARVAELVDATRIAVCHCAIADWANRLDALQARWDEMRRLMRARAWECRDVPGGDTGLLEKRIRLLRAGRGKSDEPYEVVEYRFDAALLRELRETEKQAAMEMAQWIEPQPEREPDPFLKAINSFLHGIDERTRARRAAVLPPDPLDEIG